MKELLLLTGLFISQFCFTQTPPKILYATYIGGLGDDDWPTNIQLGENDEIYVSMSASDGCITTPGVHQATHSGGVVDVLIQKRDKNANLVWSTYYGGAGEDIVNRMTLLKTGKLAAVGQTKSLSKIAGNGHQNTHGGGGTDGFLAKFSAGGTLLWSTYIGWAALDAIYTMQIDKNDVIWLGGTSYSTNGLSTADAYKSANSGNGDGLLVSFDKEGHKLYCTYYGGLGEDEIYIVCVDETENVWLGGPTSSPGGIATPGAIKTTFDGVYDVYLVKFNKDLEREWSTFLGGSGWDTFFGMDADKDGNVVLALMSASNNFSLAKNAMQSQYGGGDFDAVYTKIDPEGNLIWSTYHGGNGNDRAIDAKVNSGGDLVFLMYAGSQRMNTGDADDQSLDGNTDALLTIIREENTNSVSRSESGQGNYKIFPNPATETLILEIPDIDNYRLDIIDISGKPVSNYTRNGNELTVKNLQNGLYYIRLYGKKTSGVTGISFVKI